MSPMNFWPPNPGSTVMTRTMSAAPASTNSATASAGVPGLSATPARIPASRTRRQRDKGSGVDSTWKVYC